MSMVVKSKPELESFLIEKYNEVKDQLKPGFSKIREKALEKFKEIGIPHKKHEMFSFVNTRELFQDDVQIACEKSKTITSVKGYVLSSCINSNIIIENGAFRDDLSDYSALSESIIVESLEQALDEHDVESYLLNIVNQEDDAFSVINSIFLNDGVVIKVKASEKNLTPLQIINITSGSPSVNMVNPRVYVHIENEAEFNIINSYISSDKGCFNNSVYDYVVDSEAVLNVHHFQDEAFDSCNFSKTNVSQGAKSRFFGVNASKGSRLTRYNYNGTLKGEEADFTIKNLAIVEDKEEVHYYVRVHHQAENCTSEQLFKNILKDSSHTSVDTTVVVHEGAQLTDSHQLINNLMLSDEAEADNKPNLMIYADDVKCAHGATIGQISDDQLFYLISRGLSKNQAKAILTTSFANVVLDEFTNEELSKQINNVLLKKLEG